MSPRYRALSDPAACRAGAAAVRPRRRSFWAFCSVLLLALLAASVLIGVPPAFAAGSADAPSDTQAVEGDLVRRSQALQRASRAVIGLQVVALDDARSAKTLGQSRSGSGVVIGADGLVLTIGYLVLEADQVQLVLDNGQTVPARVLGYDQATGFGLVQALTPLTLVPVPLGRPDRLAGTQALMIATGGGAGDVSPARLVARRAFSGF